MYKCDRGHRFEKPKELCVVSDPAREKWDACPKCYSTRIYQAEEWDEILKKLYGDFNDLLEQIEEYKLSKYKDFREFLEENYD